MFKIIFVWNILTIQSDFKFKMAHTVYIFIIKALSLFVFQPPGVSLLMDHTHMGLWWHMQGQVFPTSDVLLFFLTENTSQSLLESYLIQNTV